MNNRRALMMMALAIVLGLVAVVLASRWLLRQTPASANKIIVAATDVNLGQRLTPEMLKAIDWPADNLPRGAIRDGSKLVGRVLKTSVLRDEPLSEAKLAPAGTLGGLSALISEGKRAITVRVNDVVGVAGFALPGNFVDILVNTQAAATGNENAISKIVLERILVLAVAQEVGRDETKPRVVNAVTLEVTPAQAENIDLARSVGTLSLVLRNQVDPRPGVTGGATKTSLLGIARPPVAPPAETPAAVAKPRAQLAQAAPRARACVGVIAGVQRTQECL
ncbi:MULTISPECIES: Flp pilus assembly protein CpaB [unclassified Duganella]|uniref:Flp pilus assembly protein CpaB n=1 Tax=unclassified Duganella TaxID=2636909 RepID=UPI000E34A347|nr:MULTISPECIES: Flp pilus assembly protein CpaB [unclassified Duganella]RFP12623.1 Flp pilus assembly protein CpaB [Duganella sp. BJB475]RFP28599.1 Flp pilus assembly protein CpaB [Duganella sp. BJB476]